MAVTSGAANTGPAAHAKRGGRQPGPHYKWIALSNTTLGVGPSGWPARHPGMQRPPTATAPGHLPASREVELNGHPETAQLTLPLAREAVPSPGGDPALRAARRKRLVPPTVLAAGGGGPRQADIMLTRPE